MKRNKWLNFWIYNDPEGFKKFCFYIIEHLSDLLSEGRSHEELSTLFKFVFKKTPTYNQINNQTFQLNLIFALNTKKEPQLNWSSSINLKWQTTTLQNRTNLTEYLNKAVSKNISSFQKQIDNWYEIFTISLEKWYFWL